jgi:hypothetical protein
MRWLSLLLLVGCAPHREILVQQSLRSDVPQHGTNGLIARADALTYDNWKQEKRIVAHLVWKELDRNKPVEMGSGSGVGGIAEGAALQRDEFHRLLLPTIRQYADEPLLPLPSFKVTLLNWGQTGIDLTRAELQLTDAQGRSWPVLGDAASVQGRLEAWLLETHRDLGGDLNQGILDTLRGVVAELPLWNGTLHLAPGARWTGYVSFDLPVRSRDELDAFLSTVGKLQLTITGVARDDGAQVEPLVFEFVPAGHEVAVVCPPEVRHASWKKCKADEVATASRR